MPLDYLLDGGCHVSYVLCAEPGAVDPSAVQHVDVVLVDHSRGLRLIQSCKTKHAALATVRDGDEQGRKGGRVHVLGELPRENCRQKNLRDVVPRSWHTLRFQLGREHLPHFQDPPANLGKLCAPRREGLGTPDDETSDLRCGRISHVAFLSR